MYNLLIPTSFSLLPSSLNIHFITLFFKLERFKNATGLASRLNETKNLELNCLNIQILTFMN